MSSPPLIRRLWDDVLVRVAIHYGVLLGVGAFIWHRLPRSAAGRIAGPLAELLGGAGVAAADSMSKSALRELMTDEAARAGTSPFDVAFITVIAIVSAALLTLPVAWVYTLTRKKKGYQQSVVQSLVFLPVVVAAIVMMVKHSIPLAFSLGAIVSAVRFRTSLEDSKDAVYLVLTMGIGIASGVELSIAIVMSVMFNAAAVLLWATDFGRSPALEGARAQRQLDRALATANRTGMFIAKLDEEVLKTLSPEQLETLADRAWRRRKRMGSNDEEQLKTADVEVLLRLQVTDVAAARATVEPLLDTYLQPWRFSGTYRDDDGIASVLWLEYAGTLVGTVLKQEVLFDLRTRGAPHVLKCELK